MTAATFFPIIGRRLPDLIFYYKNIMKTEIWRFSNDKWEHLSINNFSIGVVARSGSVRANARWFKDPE